MTQPVILFHFITNARFSKEIVKFSFITPNIVRTGWITNVIHLPHSRGKGNCFGKLSNSLKSKFVWDSRVHLNQWHSIRRLSKAYAYFGKNSIFFFFLARILDRDELWCSSSQMVKPGERPLANKKVLLGKPDFRHQRALKAMYDFCGEHGRCDGGGTTHRSR